MRTTKLLVRGLGWLGPNTFTIEGLARGMTLVEAESVSEALQKVFPETTGSIELQRSGRLEPEQIELIRRDALNLIESIFRDTTDTIRTNTNNWIRSIEVLRGDLRDRWKGNAKGPFFAFSPDLMAELIRSIESKQGWRAVGTIASIAGYLVEIEDQIRFENEPKEENA